MQIDNTNDIIRLPGNKNVKAVKEQVKKIITSMLLAILTQYRI